MCGEAELKSLHRLCTEYVHAYHREHLSFSIVHNTTRNAALEPRDACNPAVHRFAHVFGHTCTQNNTRCCMVACIAHACTADNMWLLGKTHAQHCHVSRGAQSGGRRALMLFGRHQRLFGAFLSLQHNRVSPGRSAGVFSIGCTARCLLFGMSSSSVQQQQHCLLCCQDCCIFHLVLPPGQGWKHCWTRCPRAGEFSVCVGMCTVLGLWGVLSLVRTVLCCGVWPAVWQNPTYMQDCQISGGAKAVVSCVA